MNHGRVAQTVGRRTAAVAAALALTVGSPATPALASGSVDASGYLAGSGQGPASAAAQALSVDELRRQATEAGLRGDWRQARELLERARRLGPPRSDVLFDLGLALERTSEPLEAASAYREALEADPASVAAAENLASLLADHGDLDGAIHLLTATLERQPQAGSLHYHLALLVFRKEQGPTELAVRSLERAAELGYAQPHLFLLRGRVARVQGQAEAAAVFLREGLSLAPADPELSRELGLALAAQEELAEAIESLARAAALVPGDAGFAADHARVLLRADDPAEALRVLAPFDATDDPDIVYLIGQAQGDLGLPAARETLRRFQDLKRREKAAAEASSRAMAEVGSGVMSWEAGDLDAAAGHFERALAERPGWAPALSYLAATRLESGQVEAAVDIAERLLEVDPENAQALMVLGRARMPSSPEEGLAFLQRAVERYPFRVVCLLSLAEAYAESGRRQEAEALLQRAAQVEPDNPWIAEIRARLEV